MPNLTVKKYDGTTDIVWTLVQLGGSDSSRPAIWRSQTVGNAVGHQPELRYYVRRGGSGQPNESILTGVYPSLSTDTTTGQTSIFRRQKFKFSFLLDQEAPTIDVNEGCVQMVNLMDNAALMDYIRGALTVNS